MSILRSLITLPILCALLAGSLGCTQSGPEGIRVVEDPVARDSAERRGHGTPPESPRDGYRHTLVVDERPLELVYESDFGFYVVTTVPDRYYWNGYFLRLEGDRWQASAGIDGPWESWSDGSLPRSAAKARAHAGKAKGQVEGLAKPAKGDW